MATDENVVPKRQPVKPNLASAAAQAAARPPDPGWARPPLADVKQALGGSLNERQQRIYADGIFDFDQQKGPWSAEGLREVDQANVWYEESSRRQSERFARERAERADREARRAAQAVIDQTCTECHEQFAHLASMSTKVCESCLETRLVAVETEFETAEAQRLAKQSEKIWTQEENDSERRKWRMVRDVAQRRATTRLPLIDQCLARIEHRHAWLHSRKLLTRRQARRLSNRQYRLIRFQERLRTKKEKTETGYQKWLMAELSDRRHNGEHPTHWYCDWDGVPIAWGSGSTFCDNVCHTKIEQRGDISVRPVVCGGCGHALHHMSPAHLATLPRFEDYILHTYACLRSQPIDSDDYIAFGPDAECWKSIIPWAAPVWSTKDRLKELIPHFTPPSRVLDSGERLALSSPGGTDAENVYALLMTEEHAAPTNWISRKRLAVLARISDGRLSAALRQLLVDSRIERKPQGKADFYRVV